MTKKRYLLIAQLGTPDSLEKADVSSYLSEFLMDPGTITLPYLLRLILVKGMIVPRRSDKVIDRYMQIWDDQRGSPLKYHSEDLVASLEELLKDRFEVKLGMLYGTPNLTDVIKNIASEKGVSLTILPMFPHDTSATTGAIRRKVESLVANLDFLPSLIWSPVFYSEDWFIKTLSSKISQYGPEQFDQVIFSFHGLPMKQAMVNQNGKNYIEVCFETVNLLAGELNLKKEHYQVSFQSRFGKNWTNPQTSDILDELASQEKSVLLVSPSFVADCLETSWEIGISFKENFLKKGGNKFEWVTSLNSDPEWANAISQMIQ